MSAVIETWGGNYNTVYNDPITISSNVGSLHDVSILCACNTIPHSFTVSDFTTTGLSNVTLLLTSTSSNNNVACILMGIITASSYSWTFNNNLGNIGFAAIAAVTIGGALLYPSQMVKRTAKKQAVSTNANTGALNVQNGNVIVACVSGYLQPYSAPEVYQDIFNQGDSTYAVMDACCYIVPSDGSYNTTWTNASDDWASAAIEFNITLNQIMIYDGANWIPCTINYWNGSAWTVQELDIYEAGAFLPVYQSAV